MQLLLQFQRRTHYGFELGWVVRNDMVCEPEEVKRAGRGDYGNSKNSFAPLMQVHGMLENTVLSLPFLEDPWYTDQATETPFYICSRNFSASFPE